MSAVKSAFWKWTTMGMLLASVLLFTQAEAVGGPRGLLQVGETSELRSPIESELGTVPLAPGPGHDGQISYAIGLDLPGREVPELLDHGAYRYRRILFPLLASAFGTLEGEALLWGMILVVAASAGVTAGVTGALAVRSGYSDWLALVVLANPGVWLSVRLLAPDALALALMAVGIYAVLRRPKFSIAGFAGSLLAKEAYAVTPIGVLFERGRRWHAVVPLGLLFVWMGWLTMTMANGFSGRGNFALPFQGLVEASANWRRLGGEELVYLAFAIVSVLAGLVYSTLWRGFLRWSILGWALLGLVSSNWIWDFGNNAARVFAPIVVLMALSRFGARRDIAIDPTVAVR